MAKVKRYRNDGYVTSEDSNYGMKEARDAIDADIAKTPSADYGDYISESSSKTVKASKPKMVTKEELAKSGLSLRDYMNQQQGLTRRGETSSRIEPPQPPAPQPVPNVNDDRFGTFDQGLAGSKYSETVPSSMSMKDKITKEAIDSIKASGRKYPDMSALQAPAKRAGMTAMGRKNSGFDQNSDVSFKQGGSVSSASKRADGIAVKGKTRGKIC